MYPAPRSPALVALAQLLRRLVKLRPDHHVEEVRIQQAQLPGVQLSGKPLQVLGRGYAAGGPAKLLVCGQPRDHVAGCDHRVGQHGQRGEADQVVNRLHAGRIQVPAISLGLHPGDVGAGVIVGGQLLRLVEQILGLLGALVEALAKGANLRQAFAVPLDERGDHLVELVFVP
jgi:hypothetical protein